jgi:hypothetical protein
MFPNKGTPSTAEERRKNPSKSQPVKKENEEKKRTPQKKKTKFVSSSQPKECSKRYVEKHGEGRFVE